MLGKLAGSGAKRSRKAAISGNAPVARMPVISVAQFGFASPVVGQGENIDGELAGHLLGQRCHGGLVKLALGVARKELIAVDQTGQSPQL